MNKGIILGFTALLLVPVIATNAFAAVEFSEYFDGTPTNQYSGAPVTSGAAGHTPENCDNIRNFIFGTTQSVGYPDYNPPTGPNWGVVQITGGGSTNGVDTIVTCSADFTVPSTGDYDVSAWVGAHPCAGCNEVARLYIDKATNPTPVFEFIGDNLNQGGEANDGLITQKFSPTPVTLDAGVTHTVEIELFVANPGVGSGIFFAYFDDILIEDASDHMEGTVTISGVCEVDLASGSLGFAAGDPISNGAGVGVGEISEVMTNTLGNLQSQVAVYGTDWTDGGALTVMQGGNTRVDTASGDISSKTALSTDDQNPTNLANIAPQGSITSYWDVGIVMNGADRGYSGPSVQTITVDFTCV